MDRIIDIGNEEILRILLEDEDIVDKLNKINNTHYQISKPFKKEDLEKLIENVKAYNYDKPTMAQLKNGR